MVFIYQSCSQRFRPIDHCVWLSYFSSVFLAFRFALMFCILAVCVHCSCVLPLSGVIKKYNNNNNKGITSLCSVRIFILSFTLFQSDYLTLGGLVAEWLACWTQAQKARVQIAVAMLLGNSLRQTVHTYRGLCSPSSKIGSSPVKGYGGNCRPGGK